MRKSELERQLWTIFEESREGKWIISWKRSRIGMVRMDSNKQNMKNSWCRSYVFIIALWILGSVIEENEKENKKILIWRKGLLRKYTHGVDGKSMGIHGNGYTLPISFFFFF